jgi:hypothetical protein
MKGQPQTILGWVLFAIRASLLSFLVGIVPDVLIAVVAAYVTQSGVKGFFVVLVGLQALYLLVWARKSIWSWLLFWMRGRRLMADAMVDTLRTNRFPEPDEYHENVDDYFEEVMSNDRLPDKVRLNAATLLGERNGERLAKMQLFIQMDRAFTDAIQRFKRSFPPGASDDISEAQADDELVKRKCVDIAISLSGLSDPNRATRQTAIAQYVKSRNEAIAMAVAIGTEFHRDSAIRHVIRVCREANDLKTARSLFERVHDDDLHEIILKECPECGRSSDKAAT